MVITSRIHCALPCVSMGVPVIFLDYKFDSKSDRSRFDGILDFFPTFRCDNSSDIKKIKNYAKGVFGKTIKDETVQGVSNILINTVNNFLKK